MTELFVDDQFRSVLAPLAPEVFQALEEQVLELEEFLDPWHVWYDEQDRLVIVDGMHRHQIQQKHPHIRRPDLVTLTGTRAEMVAWILKHQASRRNDSAAMSNYLEGRCYGESIDSGKTVGEVARETGQDRRSVARKRDFSAAVDSVDPEVANAVLSGERAASTATLEKIAESPEEEQQEMLEESRRTGGSLAEAVSRRGSDDRMKQCRARFAVCADLLASFRSAFKDLQQQFGGELAANEPAVLRNVVEIENSLKAMKPEGYCPYCDGTVAENIVERTTACKKCRGRGWLPKSTMKQVPEDVKHAHEQG